MPGLGLLLTVQLHLLFVAVNFFFFAEIVMAAVESTLDNTAITLIRRDLSIGDEE